MSRWKGVGEMNPFFSRTQYKQHPDMGDSNSIVPSPSMTCIQGNLESTPKKVVKSCICGITSEVIKERICVSA